MNHTFISIKQAEDYTGKSRSSLRRFVEAITKPENHPDRKFIEPTIDEVAEFHSANHPFSWRVSTELLDREFKKGNEGKVSNQAGSPQVDTMVSLLQETIAMLNTELSEKNKQISEFQQRQRETNILIQQTTEKLVMLTEGPRRTNHATEGTITVKSNASQSRGVDDESIQPQKKTLWQRLNAKIF